MFEEFYGMSHTPFTRNLPPDALYESDSISEAFGRLTYSIENREFVVLTADSGCGKSTQIRKLKAVLPADKYLLLYLSDSKLTPRWLYSGFLEQLNIAPRFYRGDAKRQLQKEIATIRNKEGRKVICVLDEAHLLDRETLEEFRFLLNCDCDSASPMMLILSGQTELWDEKLRLRSYTAIRERVDLYITLPRLDRAETDAYIGSHLKYAGCGKEIFSEDAVDEIYRKTSGVMRSINRICEKCLMYGAQQNRRIVDGYIVRHICEHEMLGGGDV